MKLNFSSLLVMAVSSPIYATPFESFMDEVYETSPLLGIEKHYVKAAEERLESQRRYFLPKVKSENSQTTEVYTGKDTSKLNLNLESLIYSSDTEHNIDEATFNYLDAENKLLTKYDEIRYSVLKSAIEIEQYKNLLKEVDVLLQDTHDLKSRIEKRVKLGVSLSSDLSQVNLLSSRIQNEITILNKNINLAKVSIKNTTGIDYPARDIWINEDYKSYVHHFQPDVANLRNNFKYLNLVYKSEIAKKQMLKQDPLFNVTLSGDYNSNKDQGWSEEFSAAINVNINIFDYNQKKEVNAMLSLYKASQVEMDLFYKTLGINLDEYLFLDESYRSEIKNLDYQIRQSEVIVSDHQKQYNIGKVSLYEMLNTKFDLFNQKLKRANAYISFKKNKLDMMEVAREVE